MPAVQPLYLGDNDGGDPPWRGHWETGVAAADREDLPYSVEVWNETGEDVERLVAITVSPALAYAAYYAAAREFFGRDVTIKHRGQVLAHWRAQPG